MKDHNFVKFQKWLPKLFLTKLAGRLALCRLKWLKNALITHFVKYFKVDLTQSVLERPQQFDNLNHFFTRELKSKVRSIASDATAIVSPVDGTISQIGVITGEKILQAKGHSYHLTDLLVADAERVQQYQNGQFSVIYLAPKDYHRIHCPFSAQLEKAVYVPGSFYSVNPATVAQLPNLFARNERLVCYMRSATLGPYCLIMVGALIVSGIETIWHGNYGHRDTLIDKNYDIYQFDKGAELGRFNIGSTVVLLFPPDTMRWHTQLQSGSTLCMGQSIASQC